MEVTIVRIAVVGAIAVETEVVGAAVTRVAVIGATTTKHGSIKEVLTQRRKRGAEVGDEIVEHCGVFHHNARLTFTFCQSKLSGIIKGQDMKSS